MYSRYQDNIAIFEPLIGQSGTLTLTRFTIKSIEMEDHLILAAITQDGQERDTENRKINFGQAHFDALGVNYKVAINIQEVLSEV